MSKDNLGTHKDGWDDDNPDPLGLIGWELANKYKIVGYIGSGGFADVYHGFNLNLSQQRVVVKIIKREEYTVKFEKEATILSELDHPNICRIVDFLPEDRAIIVPFINGNNCEEILKNEGPLTEQQFFKVVRTILSALQVAHSMKIAHRDIKPSNIMIDKRGHVYLIDFGIAKRIGGTVTKTGYRAMTPQFAAPERHREPHGYNPFLSDIYELGVTFYYLLTREPVYRNKIYPNISEWGGPAKRKISTQLLKVLQKATHPNYKKRFQTIEDFQSAFNRVKTVRKSFVSRYIGTLILVILLVALSYLARDDMQRLWTEYVPVLDSLFRIEAPAETLTVAEIKLKDSTESLVIDTVVEEENDNFLQADVPDVTVEDTAQVVPESIVEPPIPPPAVEHNIQIDVLPMKNAQALLGDVLFPIGERITADTGLQIITIMQPDFPIVRNTLQLHADTNVTYNLAEMFHDNQVFTLQIGISPPLREGHLAVTLNGRTEKYGRFPVRNIKRIIGEWMIGFGVEIDDHARAVVDSFVISLGRSDAGMTVLSSDSTIDFSQFKLNARNIARLNVYWTKQ
ncbi:MAG: serine/threonine-protein kinase [candidate division Zixibacteria bacterium]|nr:serine/threonine-protein kinase [candidate division Zixibacteria bacterium]